MPPPVPFPPFPPVKPETARDRQSKNDSEADSKADTRTATVELLSDDDTGNDPETGKETVTLAPVRENTFGNVTEEALRQNGRPMFELMVSFLHQALEHDHPLFDTLPREFGGRGTSLTSAKIDLYCALAPEPPTPEEYRRIRVELNSNAEYDKQVADYLAEHDGQELYHPGCELYWRHIRSKRFQFLGPGWGPAPGTTDDQFSTLNRGHTGHVSGSIFSPLFDASEYGDDLTMKNGKIVELTNNGKSAQGPLVPNGAPIINGMQSLIKLDCWSTEYPVTRNSGWQGNSEKAIQDLQPILIQDMKPNVQQEGKYLLCRVVSAPIVLLDMSVWVADEEGKTMRLSIHNTPIQPVHLGYPGISEYEAMFPLDTILLIKEPYLDDELESPNIPVTSPTDIKIISLKDPLVANVTWKKFRSAVPGAIHEMGQERPEPFDKMKQDAEALFAEGSFFLAERKTTKAIEEYHDHPDVTSLRALRAEIDMKLERWYQAEADAEFVVESTMHQIDKGDAGKKKRKSLGAMLRKAMLIAALSLYKVRAWKAAEVAFERGLQRYTDSDPFRYGLSQTRDRIKETETGVYDWLAIAQAAYKGDLTHQIGDYVGSIEERDFSGMGKGMVASKDLKAGELLVATNALHISNAKEAEDMIDAGSERGYHMMRSGYKPVFWSGMQALVYKAYWQPELNKQLKSLYHGAEFPPRPNYPFTDNTDYRGVDPDPINAMAMDCVLALNMFGIASGGGSLDHGVVFDSNGLFPSLSLFNNSCKPNCSLQKIGNFMSVRANEDIPAGTELCVTYNCAEEYVHRCVKLERLMGVPCSCEHCKDDQKDGMDAHAKRIEMRKSVQDRIDTEDWPDWRHPPAAHVAYFKKREKQTLGDIEEMMETYGSHRDDYRPDLTVFYRDLCGIASMAVHHNRGPDQIQLFIDASIGSLRCSGIELADDPKPKGKDRSIRQFSGLPIRTLPYTGIEAAIQTMIHLSIWYSRKKRDQRTSLAWSKAAETVAFLTIAPCPKLYKFQFDLFRQTAEIGLMN